MWQLDTINVIVPVTQRINMKRAQYSMLLKSMKKTKIIATLGSSGSDADMVRKLCNAGVNIFRLNFSHGNHDTHKRNAVTIRRIEQELGYPIAIMMDLQGPKIRIGIFEDGKVILKSGSSFFLDLDTKFGDSKRVALPHPEIFNAIKEGADLLLDDGRIKLHVVGNCGTRIETKVMNGGVLSNKKGVNIPNIVLPINSITDKDKKDLKIVDEIGADYVAVSFVQRPEDITHTRNIIDNPEVQIIAKIEKPKAIENLDSIVAEADGVMVARGDLGVEMPIEMIPGLQKLIVKTCKKHGKPVIVATQMLESMTESQTPTRAEVSDIANAVEQGADAVMLSAETANGKYPVESVAVMHKVIKQVENDLICGDSLSNDLNESIGKILHVPYDKIKLIAAFTESGRTAKNVAGERPKAFIISFTPNIKTARRMCLVWGTYAFLIEEIYSFIQMVTIVKTKMPKICSHEIQGTEVVAIVAGVPFRKSGFTNILHICEVSNTSDDENES